MIELRIGCMTEEALRTMIEAGIGIKTKAQAETEQGRTKAQAEMEQGKQEGEISTWTSLQCLQTITDKDGNMVLDHHLIEVASVDQTSPKLLMLKLMTRYQIKVHKRCLGVKILPMIH